MPLDTGGSLQDRYQIRAALGQGGMGAVYAAWDSRLDVPVAVKEMVPQPGLDPRRLADLRVQFRSEAQVLARLDHPNLVRVTDFFQEGENAYLVMSFVAGESMAHRIRREGPLPAAEVLAWGDQLCGALAYCHASGVLHRDVKPHNVIVQPDGQAVLVDFGLVKLWDPDDPHTRTAIRAMGTPEYAPPEQYDAQIGHTDPRSDIYGLGATLYHALSGHAPPTATQRVVNPDALVPLAQLNPNVSRELEQAVMRALALQPSRRYGGAEEMRTALRAAGQAVSPASATDAQRRAGPGPVETAPVVSPAAAPILASAREPARKIRVPVWAWVLLGLAGLAVVGTAASLFARGDRRAAIGVGGFTPSPSSSQVAALTVTSATLLTGSPTGVSENGLGGPEIDPSVSPTRTPSPTPAVTPTSTGTPAPSATPLPSASATPPPTATSSPQPTPTRTPTPEVAGPTGLRVTGRVLWGSHPVPGARIELKEQGSYYQEPVLVQTSTDDEGRFTLESPPAGAYQIYAVSPSDEYWSWTGRSIEIPADAAVDGGTFYLKKKLQLLEPADRGTVGTNTPTLRWQGFPGATRYHVDLFVDATGDPVLRQGTPDTSLTLSTPLVSGVRYQWSVEAYDSGGTAIAYFSAWTFTVD